MKILRCFQQQSASLFTDLCHTSYFVHRFLQTSFISITMPFVDLNKRLGVNLDHWILTQSGPQPHQRAARCHAFEKEWIECSHGIGQTRAKKECQLEFEDFYECMHRQKTVSLSGFLKKNA